MPINLDLPKHNRHFIRNSFTMHNFGHLANYVMLNGISPLYSSTEKLWEKRIIVQIAISHDLCRKCDNCNGI